MEFLRFRLNRLCCCAFALGTLAFATLLSVPVSAQDRARGEATDEKLQDLYSRARTAQAAGNLSEAAAQYEEILKISPRLAAAYNNLGSIYVQQREFRKAAQVLQRGLQINRDMPSASALLGIALYEMGDYAGAKPRLEVALRANPDAPRTEKPGSLVSARQGIHAAVTSIARQAERNRSHFVFVSSNFRRSHGKHEQHGRRVARIQASGGSRSRPPRHALSSGKRLLEVIDVGSRTKRIPS